MRLGVLDIGSNTVHLLLVDAHPGARPSAYADHKRSLSLLQHQDERGRIKPSGQDALITFINEAVTFAVANAAEDMIAFCTSAIRESANGAEVLDRVTRETSVHLTELSGDQEAAMTYFAVRRWQGWDVGSILNFDIGGGSFEIAYGTDELPSHAVSIPLGAGRLTRDWLPADPPTPKSVKKLRKHIRATMDEAAGGFPTMTAPVLVTGTSKTFRSLARITGAAPLAAGVFVKRHLRIEDLKLWVHRMGAMTSKDRAGLPGVSEVRAAQMLAGGLAAEAAMERFGVAALEICPWALREGLIMRRLDALVQEGILGQETVRGVGNVRLNPDPMLPGFSVGVTID